MKNVGDIVETTAFARAKAFLKADHHHFVDEIIHLTEIPSPPFGEAERAAEYARMMQAEGLEDVTTDAEGNVTGLLRGRNNGQMVAVSAHLDTVFPAGTDVTVRREGTKLFAPGIGDDTRGLAVLLAMVRAIKAAGIRPEQDILFVGDVGEEGLGDLRGIRYLFTQSAHRDKIGAFFSIDGSDTARLVTAGVGSYRYRVSFTGPGGHSYGSFGTVNPAWALGDFLAGMARIEVPADPKTTFSASVFTGGSSINAIPEAVHVDIDLRSAAPAELDRLDAEVHALAKASVAAENARNDTANGEISVTFTRLGNRPAGQPLADCPVTAASLDAIRAFGFEPATEISSTDANIPISLGIPAVAFGNGGTSGRAHSLDEWIDVEEELSLRGLYAALAAVLGVAGMAEDQSAR
ncbi:M20/M25/M40 family metallo-hydrolase [Acidimangrovimonas sediminis]|uniref:M20/M25/M40 family metallo-hydrolase n=1 Tax=Acidimangrovimonas sediminis TaxID=2056283 RepID=UPI000C807482|nr:M20/M25/M40 family metallo-hydrolase [Acidimangrovimonas sediminis]